MVSTTDSVPFSKSLSIILNHGPHKFNCSKSCSYCYWKASPVLPDRLPTEVEIKKLSEHKSKTITVSGGGDPLFHVDDELLEFFKLLREANPDKRIRVITRETEKIALVKEYVDCFSISLDDDTMKNVTNLHKEWDGRVSLEYSIVLPPVNFLHMTPQREDFLKYLGRLSETLPGPLVLRENSKSLFKIRSEDIARAFAPLKMSKKLVFLSCTSFGKDIYDFVPGYSRMRSKNFTEITGRSLLKKYLTNEDIMIYGSVVKHITNSWVFPKYNDIDLCYNGGTQKFQQFIKILLDSEIFTSVSNHLPEFFTIHSIFLGVNLTFRRFSSRRDMLDYIYTAEYDVDRAYHSMMKVVPYAKTFKAYREQISNKIAIQLSPNPVGRNRIAFEHRKTKLLGDGWVLNNLAYDLHPQEEIIF